jgi:hypothetical protein
MRGGERRRHGAPPRPGQFAVRERAGDDGGYLRHAFEHRSHPGRREDVDGRRRLARLEQRQQRLADDCVADPGGRHDQGPRWTHAGALVCRCAAGSRRVARQ